MTQSAPNADGSYTFVLAKHDPGVHNWLDPCDMSAGILTLRWAEFPGGRPTPEVGAASRVVSFPKLRDALVEETAFVSPEERVRQSATRAAGYARRLPEG